jgi:hypothetical protein
MGQFLVGTVLFTFGRRCFRLSRTDSDVSTAYADIAFIPWQHVMGVALKEDYDQSKFPNVQKWFDAINGRPAVQTVLERAAQFGSH